MAGKGGQLGGNEKIDGAVIGKDYYGTYSSSLMAEFNHILMTYRSYNNQENPDEVFLNDINRNPMPSRAFTCNELLAPAAAKNQPQNIISDYKRLIGRRLFEVTVQNDMNLRSFNVLTTNESEFISNIDVENTITTNPAYLNDGMLEEKAWRNQLQKRSKVLTNMRRNYRSGSKRKLGGRHV